MKVIIDTSAWYAFILETDRFHERAEKFIRSKPNLLIIYPVLEELIALVHHRQGKKITIRVIEKIKSLTQLFYPTLNEEKEIRDVYKKTHEKIDYVDSSVIWLSRKFDLPVFGFDKHFKDIGIDLIPR